MPSLTRNRTAMVIRPLFENPASSSLSVIIPVAIKTTAALSRISPGRIASSKNATAMNTSTAKTIQDSNVILQCAPNQNAYLVSFRFCGVLSLLLFSDKYKKDNGAALINQNGF